MATNISLELVSDRIKTVMHPAITMSLFDLGMIRDIRLHDTNASLLLVLPSPDIPIVNLLITLLKDSVQEFGVELDVTIGQMTREEIQTFLAKEKEAWKGL